MGFFENLRHMAAIVAITVLGIVAQGIWIFVLVAFGIPTLIEILF